MTNRTNGHILLVVDDEEGMRDTLSDILEELDFGVDVACDGHEAVAKVKTQDYSLVLMDIRMPVMSGVAALKQIKACRPALPVIMMTAYADSVAVEEANREGAEVILYKPLDIAQALGLIKDLLTLNGRECA